MFSLEDIGQKIQQLFFTAADQMAFLEDVCVLIRDGVSAPRAVVTIRDVSKGATKEVAKSVLTAISQGKGIASGMTGWFPHTIVEIIRSGEEGGSLYETMTAAADSLSQQSGAVGAVLSAMVYPIIVFIMALIVCVFLKHSVFVNFADIRPPSTWPIEGRLLMAIATFSERWWWLTIIVILVLAFGVKKILNDSTGDFRNIIDSTPLLSLYREQMAARFMETLGLLLSNGITFKYALGILQRNTTRYLAWHIYMMQFRLSSGRENIADVLDTGMVNMEDILRLRVMAQGKGFSEALKHLGVQALRRNTQTIIRASRLGGGMMLAMDAGMAIFMIFAIYNVGQYVGS